MASVCVQKLCHRMPSKLMNWWVSILVSFCFLLTQLNENQSFVAAHWPLPINKNRPFNNKIQIIAYRIHMQNKIIVQANRLVLDYNLLHCSRWQNLCAHFAQIDFVSINSFNFYAEIHSNCMPANKLRSWHCDEKWAIANVMERTKCSNYFKMNWLFSILHFNKYL